MKQYLNTFAIISFNKNSFLNTKYEYLSENEIIKLNDINEFKSKLDEPIEQKESSLYRFWVIKNQNNDLVKVSAAFISEDNLADVFFGPFDTLENLNLYLDINNIVLGDN